MVAFAKPTTPVLQVWKTSFLPVSLFKHPSFEERE